MLGERRVLFDERADGDEPAHAVADENTVFHVVSTQHREIIVDHLFWADAFGADRAATVTALIEGDDFEAAAHEVVGDDVPTMHVDGIAVGEHDGCARAETDRADLGAVFGGDDALGCG